MSFKLHGDQDSSVRIENVYGIPLNQGLSRFNMLVVIAKPKMGAVHDI